MNDRLRARRFGTLMIAIWLAFAAQAAFAAAGKAVFVSGPVSVERDRVRPLNMGDAVEVADVIVTGEKARAQLLMGDGARIALRAGTRFRIEAFSLPSNVQAPGTVTAVAASGRSVTSLLKGGFHTRSGTIGKSDPAAYEMRTPIGTLGIRGTDYTAVFCRGDCADAPGLPSGQPIPDGLYLAVDEGTIVFTGRGLNLTLTAPTYEFIPLDAASPQQLVQPPAFLRGDGAGDLQVAGRRVRIQANNAQLAGVNERRSPTAPAQGTVALAQAGTVDAVSGTVVQPIDATSPLGRPVDLTNGATQPPQQHDLALAVPPAGNRAGFSAGNTPLDSTLMFDAGGNPTQFPAPFGAGGAAVAATYAISSASSVNAGNSAASGIRWGRWSGGSATATAAMGATPINLANASLHWILGPAFEVAPILPVTGTTGFVLAGGTNPTDTLGNVGVLRGAYLSADFTNRVAAATFSVDLNGINWLATGSAPIAANGPRFSGNFTTVRVDGRVAGAGSFTGFFTADALTPAQLNGAGASYSLTESLNQLGTVSGVAAFVPGAGQAPGSLVTQRALAFGLGLAASTGPMNEPAVDPVSQLVTDASGNLTRFVGPYQTGRLTTTATYDIGTATVLDAGADAVTGLRWGRWSGGTAAITLANNTDASESLATQSLHWIVGSAFGATPVLPQTGTASYQLVGGTNPTDTLGHVGTLGNASLSADFTNRTVTGAVLLTVDGRTWYGSGAGNFAAGSLQFAGNLTNGVVQGLAPASGTYTGFFTPTGYGSPATAGAGLLYQLSDAQGGLGTVTGAAGFAENAAAQPVAPPAFDVREVGYIADQAVFAGGPSSERDTPKLYSLDAQLNLIQFHEIINNPQAQTAFGATFALGTSTVMDTGYDSVAVLRWGRWNGGTATMTPDGGSASAVDLTRQSLHWIMSGDASAPPAIPTTGTATYTFVGGTQPTDNLGNVGAIGNATFSADFTNQLVSHSLDLTFKNYTASVTGTGSIGAAAGLAPQQFAGAYSAVAFTVNGTPGGGVGKFSGFFAGPVSAQQPLPPGAAVTYTVTSDTNITVNGTAAFRKP